jgi:hypothetical protein
MLHPTLNWGICCVNEDNRYFTQALQASAVTVLLLHHISDSAIPFKLGNTTTPPPSKEKRFKRKHLESRVCG